MGLNNGTVANQNDSGILIERGSTGDNAFMDGMNLQINLSWVQLQILHHLQVI